ncbi:general substrate transporter [Sarocladium strictum]
MDSSQAPLIASDPRDDDNELEYDADDATDTASIASRQQDSRPGLFVVLLTFAAGISGLLFGYDTGVISATLVSIGDSLSGRDLTSTDKSIITSSTALFALLISPFSSVLADSLGRKRVILCADLLFVAGAIIQALSTTVTGMVAGRCVIGAAVGAASFVVPLYIAEVAPATHRGRLVTTNVLFITLGQMVAYVAGWLLSTFAPPETAWRWMVGLGAVPAAVQGAVVFFMPETPRWLVRAGRTAEAKLVVQRVNGGATELVAEGRNRRALAIACLLQGLQQLCGFNSLMYFSATIFTLVGFKSPTLTSLTVAVTNFIFTLIALVLIDRVGRRRILLYSIPFMVAGLVLAAVGFGSLTVTINPEDPDNTGPDSSGSAGAGIVLLSIMLYVAAYALGLGNVPWMQSELFPLSVRSVGSGAATATNWACNFVVGLTFLPLMDALSPSWTFGMYGIVCAVGWGFVWRIYPETAGLTLEEARGLLENGWGVK